MAGFPFRVPRILTITMKPLLALLGLFLLAASPGFGFADFARGEFLLSTTGNVTYDSRVNGGYNGDDDLIFGLRPEIRYSRPTAQIKLEGNAGVQFNRYLDHTDYNSDDAHANLRLVIPPDIGPRVSGVAEIGYNEQNDLNYDVNQRLYSKIFRAALNGNVATGLKTSIDAGGTFLHIDRDTYGVLNQRDGTLGFTYRDFLGGTDFGLHYRRLEASTAETTFSPEIDQNSDTYSLTLSHPIYSDIRGSFTYGYRILHRAGWEDNGDTELSGSMFSLGIDGPFLPASRFPKLKSSASISYARADTPGVNDSGGNRFTGHVGLEWQARPETRLSINASRTLELSYDNRTAQTNSLYLGVHQDVGHFIELVGTAGYEHRDYPGAARNDDVYVASIGANYQATKAWSVSANYRLRDSESNLWTANYVRHLVSVAATYTF